MANNNIVKIFNNFLRPIAIIVEGSELPANTSPL